MPRESPPEQSKLSGVWMEAPHRLMQLGADRKILAWMSPPCDIHVRLQSLVRPALLDICRKVFADWFCHLCSWRFRGAHLTSYRVLGTVLGQWFTTDSNCMKVWTTSLYIIIISCPATSYGMSTYLVYHERRKWCHPQSNIRFMQYEWYWEWQSLPAACPNIHNDIFTT